MLDEKGGEVLAIRESNLKFIAHKVTAQGIKKKSIRQRFMKKLEERLVML